MSNSILRGPVNPIAPVAYTPNPDAFNYGSASKNYYYYCSEYNNQLLSASKTLYKYTNSIELTLSNFKDTTDNSYIDGTKKVNSWEVEEPLSNFIDLENNTEIDDYDGTSSTAGFVHRGSFVNFNASKKLIEQSGIGTGSSNRVYCKLYVESSKLYLETYTRPNSSTSYTRSAQTIYSPQDFADNILPRRLIVIMQAGGGGGGGAWGDDSRNGGGGGSGGYFACVINTEILWASTSNCYRFYIGSAGTGGAEGSTASPVNAGSGGDSKLEVTVKDGIFVNSYAITTTLLIAGGGGGGKTAGNTAGKAGIVKDGNGANLANITNINGLGTYFWWLPSQSGKSWEHGLDGRPGKPGNTNRTSTSQYYLYNMPDTYDMKTWGDNKKSVGGYYSGKLANANGGGAGAPSYFSNGGNSGGWAQDTVGKSPSGYGAGGGGSTYLFWVGTATGPQGGQGMLQIYAYGE